jgi:serine/threonine protein kinase
MEAFDALHPTDQILQSYGLGKLDDLLFRKVTEHLEDCPPCQRRVAELSSDSFLSRLGGAQVAAGSSALGSPPGVGPARKSGPGSAEPPDSAAVSLPTELVDHPDYEVIRELGRGGMGVVYLVHNRLMGRHEAIKVISRQLMERPVVLDRFLREIRSVARLRHPNVVAAYSATRMGESIVYAMEYVEGLDLAMLVKRKGPLPVTHASYFIHQVALGLQHAHEHGIVHRDIKPGNLILTRSGDRSTVKILDFGLNKATTDDAVDHSLTREGQMLGTPDYIAPEQTLDAQSVDIRADIYSLGCTLYYLLTARPPFRGGSLYEVLQAHHSSEATALNLVRPEVPIELALVVAKMMAKHAAQRFQTPAEVASALAPFFKKGNVASLSPKTEPFAADRATKPVAAAKANAEAARPNSDWGSLVDLKEPDRLIKEASSFHEARQTPRSRWLPIALAVSTFGLIAAWIGSSLLSKTPVGLSTDRPSKVDPVRRNESASVNLSQPLKIPKQVAPAIKPSSSPAPVPTVVGAKEASPAPEMDRQGVSGATPRLDRDLLAPAPTLARSAEAGTASGKSEPAPVDFRELVAIADLKRLTEPDAVRPREGFWPSLAPNSLENWQIADAAHIRMSDEGVYLEAGPHGNFLLTRDATHRKCTLSITLAAKAGTDAFLALRARRGQRIWRAITSRVNEERGRVYAGHQSIDFQTAEIGSGRKSFAPDKAFLMKIQLGDRNITRVNVKTDKWSSTSHDAPSQVEDSGSVGLFIKSGTVLIKALDIEDN